MERLWHFLINQFLNATRENFKKALRLSNYHDAMLKKAKDDDPADPEFTTMYDRYHPLHLDYVDIYNEWKNSGGSQQGQTLNVDQLLELLLTKVSKWEAQVRVVYDKTSPAYKAIFPKGNYPFYKGERETRILAVKTLGTALTGIVALAATKTEVDAFHTTLDGARDTQEGAKGGTKSLSAQLEQKRVSIMQMQYKNVGLLIDKFNETPALIGPFFELSILRNHRQVEFTGTLEVAENEAVLVHTFVSDDAFRVKLTGAGQATLYLATLTNGTDSTPLVITGDTETVHEISEFGAIDLGTHRHFTAVNTGGTEVHYEIELL